MKIITTVVIDGETWLRGEGDNGSYLLRGTDYKRCCVGFYCEALCMTDDLIINIETFAGIGDNDLAMKNWAYRSLAPKGDINKIYKINDDPEITDAQRIKKLKPLFAKHGVKLKFINMD